MRFRPWLIVFLNIVIISSIWIVFINMENTKAYNYRNFTASLIGAGVAIEEVGRINDSMFNTESIILQIDSQQVKVMEYVSPAEMEKDSQKLNKTKGHYYKRGKIIVFYNGSDGRTLRFLSEIMGLQFSGT